jgi:hypothetical protein
VFESCGRICCVEASLACENERLYDSVTIIDKHHSSYVDVLLTACFHVHGGCFAGAYLTLAGKRRTLIG